VLSTGLAEGKEVLQTAHVAAHLWGSKAGKRSCCYPWHRGLFSTAH